MFVSATWISLVQDFWLNRRTFQSATMGSEKLGFECYFIFIDKIISRWFDSNKKKLQSLPLLSHIILEKILLTVFTDGVQTFSLEDHNWKVTEGRTGQQQTCIALLLHCIVVLIGREQIDYRYVLYMTTRQKTWTIPLIVPSGLGHI